jgi:type II secretory pathway pseudopilin PulG
MKNKLPAFTYMEMMVVMVLSGIVIAMALTSYLWFVSLYIQRGQSRISIESRLFLYEQFRKGFLQGHVYMTDARTFSVYSIATNDSISIAVEPDAVLMKKKERSDTIPCKIVNLQCTFLNKTVLQGPVDRLTCVLLPDRNCTDTLRWTFDAQYDPAFYAKYTVQK